jgi:hypothetical protein
MPGAVHGDEGVLDDFLGVMRVTQEQGRDSDKLSVMGRIQLCQGVVG